MIIKKTNTEINDLLQRCKDASEEGTKFKWMSYEEGIWAGIEWILGNYEGDPLAA